MSLPDIQDALKTIKYPGFSRDIVSFGLVRSCDFAEGVAKVSLAITSSDPSLPPRLKREVESTLARLPGVRRVVVELSVSAVKAPAPAPQASTVEKGQSLPGIRRCVAIASGKGGVGKSTFSVNLACAVAEILRRRGRTGTVGLMDCDIYGPSVPLMMGVKDRRPEVHEEGNALIPIEAHGVKTISMGNLVDDDTPVIWRGPMVMKTIQQFVQQVRWGELDLLLVDLPPGTGDAQLSLVQTIPMSGAILVTTPQLASTQVARKGGLMFNKVNVPLLGVAENMSYLLQPDGTRLNIFGEGGAARTAAELSVPFLGSIPFHTEIREGGDTGLPIVAAKGDHPASQAFFAMAENLLRRIDPQGPGSTIA